MAILVQTIKFQIGAHGTNPRLMEETRSVSEMDAPKTLRHQHLNFVIQQLFPSITEQALYLGIGKQNLALRIHHDHSVWPRIQQSAKLPFSPLKASGPRSHSGFQFVLS